ncbi:probable endopolygalacturonase II [Dendroctonus ponderosae]|uniref:probable endopolygalacturonase II n=1 Tax=Dendroctonus ponderosae TaxID=77166 RepID=UPI0001F3B31C|nr:probable endopolygalacturonase II [Dendroctonus ponderosae]
MSAWAVKFVALFLLVQGAIGRASVGKLQEGCEITEFSEVQVAVEICDVLILENIFVPAGKTLNLNLRDQATLYFRGTITFGYAEWEGPLVAINASNAVIEGEDGAVFNGQGELYWDGLGEWGSLKPKFFIMQLHNTVMSNMYILNSPQHNVILADSTNVKLVGWVADASAGAENTDVQAGHNTDGFVIINSTNILLQNSVIYNQDDCVVVYSGSNILVEDFICYGGHGLSISAGHDDENVELNTVYNVTFSDSVVTEGKNAIHVKTHVDGGDGRIEKVVYRNIQFQGASEYGINIQENYRNLPPNSTMPDQARNNIPITDLQLINVVGSVDSSAVPIYIFCAEGGCFEWEFTEVVVTGTEANMCIYEPTEVIC